MDRHAYSTSPDLSVFRAAGARDRVVFAIGALTAVLVLAWLALAGPPRTREVVVNLAQGATATLKEGAALATVQIDRAVGGSHALRTLFAELGYGLDEVREGAPVPRVILNRMPADIHEIDSPEARKHLFVKAILPIVLEANQAILKDRARLDELYEKDAAGKEFTQRERDWLLRLADRYELDEANLVELRRRVDTVPPSLAIAQAALESGWGTSRLAQAGHSLFGQKVQRPEPGALARVGFVSIKSDGDDLVMRTFDDLSSTVTAYVQNLNTHAAYREFRAQRAVLRAHGKPLDGWQLAGAIKRYSERGRDYIKDVRGLIKANDLGALDDARLSERGHRMPLRAI